MTSSGYITELPGEILGKIFTSLDYPHLKSVRPTCRRFEPYAAARLFETVTVVLSLQGLCRLRNIALSPIIACQVRELDFQGGRLDYFGSRAEWEFEIQQRYFAKGLGSYIEYGKQELTAGWKAYRKLLNEQKAIISIGTDKDEFTRAMRAFKNIESIVVEKGTALEDLKWGSQSFSDTYGPTLLEPRGLNDWHQASKEVGAFSLPALLEILASVRADETEPKALRNISAVGISTQVMQRLEPMIPKLSDVLSQVRDVTLNFRLGEKRFPQKAKMNHAFIRPDKDLAKLRHFLQLFGMIRRLDLRFESTYNEMTDFLGLVKSVHWKHIEDVTFGGILFKESDMIDFIKDHRRTLTDVTFIDTCISRGGSWAMLLENIRDLKVVKQFWINGKMLTENVSHLASMELFSDLSCKVADYVEGQSNMINPLRDVSRASLDSL